MNLSLATVLVFLPFLLSGQQVRVEIPEQYELSNIILALTEYGQADKWEVQKNSTYYKEVMEYFKPVLDHPLLDSVNYSREKWDFYLSFRTDAYVFSFAKDGKLRRDKVFATNEGRNPFEENLELVNDFVRKSNFRKFYKAHLPYYKTLINNYREYHFIDQIYRFLDLQLGKPANYRSGSSLNVVLSPLVLRMNCHRVIDERVVADFPSATESFLSGFKGVSLETRIVDSHMPFTEIDHGYVNPISDRFSKEIAGHFDESKWSKDSGYTGIAVFNEYMTWAMYELFVNEFLPAKADSINLLWQYQNASRGFIAQNIFSEKVKELKSTAKKPEDIYIPLLKWCKSSANVISQPSVVRQGGGYTKVNVERIEINFSESMNESKSITIQIHEHRDGSTTGNRKWESIESASWSNDGKTLTLRLNTPYKQFSIGLNEWGNNLPLISKKGIFLKPWSYVFCEQL